MSGAEIVPAANMASKTAANALKTSDAEKQMLGEVARETPQMKAAAEAYATKLALKQQVLLRLFEPIARLIGVRREYLEEAFPLELAERLQDVPDEQLVSPAPILAVPAIEALGYSLDEPNLKEMYLQLLATSADNRRKSEAHPSFPDIIRQLSSEEAGALLGVLGNSHIALAEIRRPVPAPGSGWNVVASHLTPLRSIENSVRIEAARSAVWIDNWVRLGLVKATYDNYLTDDHIYDWVELHPTFLGARGTEPNNVVLEVAQGVLLPTSFGMQFRSAVTPEPETSQDQMTVKLVTAQADYNAQS